MNKSHKLLREYVKEILKEEDGGTDLYAGDNPYGMHYVSNDALYDAFVKPFVDVVQTAAGKTKELARSAFTVVQTVLTLAVTTIIPILEGDYKKIFDKQKEDMDKIRSEYGEVYKSTWDSLLKNNDLAIAAFMFSPAAFVGAEFVAKTPKTASKLLSVMSGGLLDNVLSKVSSDKKSKNSNEGVIIEDEEKDSKLTLAKIATNVKVKKIINNNSEVKKMKQQGQEIVNSTLHSILEKVSNTLTANSIQDIQNKVGKKLPGLEKLSSIPAEEKENAEQTFLSTIKKAMKQYYIVQLESQIKAAVSAGVPQNHPFIKQYSDVISKIKSM